MTSMNKESFFQFHQNKNHISIWLDGRMERLSLKKFLALPDVLFSVDQNSHSYRMRQNDIIIID